MRRNRIKYILIIICIISLSGCAVLREATELYNAPYYNGKDRITPYELADYYTTNCPDLTSNEKAELIYKQLKDDRWEIFKEEKIETKTITQIIWNGVKIWPATDEEKVQNINDLTDSLSKTSDNLEGLNDSLKQK